TAEPAVAPTAPAAAPAAPAGIPTSGPVVLTAREDVWLRITNPTSGRRVFMGVLSAGQSWTVPDGIAPVMRTGRAGVMEIRVAGVLLPPLGNTNQTIDGVVLAAPALAERFAGVALPTPQPAVQVPARPVPAQAPPA
ncbi:DUF4115 domain-containing protein, partial [Sandarakinorhabdus rubra]|uniref:DUF4115 domain-containing protein n=1 Tax=Sandarakinorhabdus rubra TaxID=2672568 RepID=UPI001969BDF8